MRHRCHGCGRFVSIEDCQVVDWAAQVRGSSLEGSLSGHGLYHPCADAPALPCGPVSSVERSLLRGPVMGANP